MKVKLVAQFGSWWSAQDIVRALRSGSDEEIVSMLTFTGAHNPDHLKAGTVEGKLFLDFDTATVKPVLIEALREKRRAVYAKAEEFATQCEREIQELLALEHKPAPEVYEDKDDIPF